MNLCVKSRFWKPNFVGSLFRYSTTTPEAIEQNEQVIFEDNDEALAKEAEIQKKRNISRLSEAHYNLINGRRPYETPKSLAHLTVKYNRKVYGKYGVTSGINPSMCWPSKKDLAETKEYESVAFPYTIQQMKEMVTKKKQEQSQRIIDRENDVAAKYAKLEMWKKELRDKIAKKQAEAEAAKNKKERLVEEVRRHFGFKLDPRDDRFKEMLAKREKEQKKLEKQAKKDAKEKVIFAKLQEKNAQTNKVEQE